MTLRKEELNTQQHVRHFIQYGGSRPGNVLRFAGLEDNYMTVEGQTLPYRGVDPIFVPDPSNSKRFIIADRSSTPPELPTATIVVREKRGGIPRPLMQPSCEFTFFDTVGDCKDLSDFLAGWSSYVMVYAGAIVTEFSGGNRSSFDADDPLDDSLSITLREIYPIGSLGFGEEAATGIDRNVVDVVYGTQESCGTCGAQSDGTKFAYALADTSGAGSPGLPAEVHYTLDGGSTWSSVNIDGLGATEAVLSIDIVGQYLMVLGADATYYALIDQDTGIPGTFTKVTTGIVAAGTPVDVFVAGPRAVFMCGDGGYIYKSTDITAGWTVINAGDTTTTDLNRIHGDGRGILFAVGDSGVVIYSINSGLTWAATAANPSASNNTAVWVFTDKYVWVGTAGGKLFYSETGGKTWTERTFSGSGSGIVYDIVAATQEAIWFSHSTTAPLARIFSSWDGGADFTNTQPRLRGVPTFDNANRLAVPTVTNAAIAANHVAVAGLAGNGSDGILLLAFPSIA